MGKDYGGKEGDIVKNSEKFRDINYWNKRDGYIGVFDILGFKRRIDNADNEVLRDILTEKLADLFEVLESDITEHGELTFTVFSDTFVVHTPDSVGSSYGWFLRQCKNLIERSIHVRLPLRGAISSGQVFTSDNPPIIIGKPFIEAYEYCEDQNWIGLLLTPSATTAISDLGLEPLHHDFISDKSIPLKKKSVENVLAYRFQNGSANFKSPLLGPLEEMRHFAPVKDKKKYDKTIEFIKKHYKHLSRV